MNIDKTKIYGFGDWHGKMDWPVIGMKVEPNHFKTLGIIFSCNYDKALEDTWKQVITKIRRRIPLIKTRNLTIYQKVIIVNVLLASKIWYVAHVYPLPITFCNEIEREFLDFIFKRNYRPIKRVVLFNSKVLGGLGLINIELKALRSCIMYLIGIPCYLISLSVVRWHLYSKMFSWVKLKKTKKIVTGFTP